MTKRLSGLDPLTLRGGGLSSCEAVGEAICGGDVPSTYVQTYGTNSPSGA